MARPATPFVAPTTGPLYQQMALVAQAINRKADASTGQPPTFHSIILVDELNQSWSVSINSSGVISGVLVPRP